MSAQGGFDPNASMLPDPGAAAAPIHVMRGGNRHAKAATSANTDTTNTNVEIDEELVNPENQRILTEYQLDSGGALEDVISDDVKTLFLTQINSGLCKAGTGSAVISHKDCSAVLQVLRELYKLQIQRGNATLNTDDDTLDSLSDASAEDDVNLESLDDLEDLPPSPQIIKLRTLMTTIRENKDNPHAGLTQCGNTCYLNSALQMLSYIPEFAETVFDIHASNEDILKRRRRVLDILSKLYSSKTPINLQEGGELSVFDVIFEDLSRDRHEQQDAGEFIQLLITRLELEPIVKYFNYTRTDSIQCQSGQLEGTESKEPIRTEDVILRLDLPRESTSVQDLLNTVQNKRDTVYDVEDCIDPRNPGNPRGVASRTTTYSLDDANRYLIIQLTRFDLHGDKIQVGIQTDARIQFLGKSYSLYGSILHRGNSIKSGHYIFMKIKGDLESGIIYDDETVVPIDHIYTSNYNGITLNNNSYLLMYALDTLPDLENSSPLSEGDMAAGQPRYTLEQIETALNNPKISSIDETSNDVITLLVSDLNKHRRIAQTSQRNTGKLKRVRDALTKLYDINEIRTTDKAERNLAAAQAAAAGAASDAVPPAPVGAAPPQPPGAQPSNGNISPLPPNLIGAQPPSNLPPAAAPGAQPSNGNISPLPPNLIGAQPPSNLPIGAPSADAIPPAPGSIGAPPIDYGAITPNSYIENPPNFQEGHLRIDFAAPNENKRVYANTTLGRQRTRIYGKNAANLKRKYNTRKQKLNRAARNAKENYERLQERQTAAAAARKSQVEAAAAEAKRKAAEAKEAADTAKRAKETQKRNTAYSTKLQKEADERARLARVAQGLEKPSVSNRFKGMFKRGGGNKTRRNGRRGTSRRRSN
jgi:hypothetical protein